MKHLEELLICIQITQTINHSRGKVRPVRLVLSAAHEISSPVKDTVTNQIQK